MRAFLLAVLLASASSTARADLVLLEYTSLRANEGGVRTTLLPQTHMLFDRHLVEKRLGFWGYVHAASPNRGQGYLGLVVPFLHGWEVGAGVGLGLALEMENPAHVMGYVSYHRHELALLALISRGPEDWWWRFEVEADIGHEFALGVEAESEEGAGPVLLFRPNLPKSLPRVQARLTAVYEWHEHEWKCFLAFRYR